MVDACIYYYKSTPPDEINYRDREAEAQYEYLQCYVTIMNLSNKQIGGFGDLSWGKWMSGKSPRFPISPYGEVTFASQGVSYL